MKKQEKYKRNIAIISSINLFIFKACQSNNTTNLNRLAKALVMLPYTTAVATYFPPTFPVNLIESLINESESILDKKSSRQNFPFPFD